MPATVQFNIKEVKTLIDQLSLEEKNELSKYLNKLTLQTRIEQIRRSNKNAKFTEKEIVGIVKKVRKKTYKSKK